MPYVFAVSALIFLKAFIAPAQFSENFKVLRAVFNGVLQVAFGTEIFFDIVLIISKMANLL